MPTNNASLPNQLAARLASVHRRGMSTLLSCDTTLRSIVLGEGGWHLHGSATQIYYTTRAATDSAGTLASGEVAPLIATFAAAVAGTPGAGQLVDPAQNGVKQLRVPTDISDMVEISVARGCFVVLYAAVASGTATCVLEGPYDLGKAQEIPSQ